MTSPWREAIGPAYQADGACRLLGVTESELCRRVTAQEIFELTTSDGVTVYPRFQFEGQQVLPGLSEVLAAMCEPNDAGLAWDWASWITTPVRLLDNLSVVEWLRQGHDIGQAVSIVRRISRLWSH
jgi:hypothetical protein